MSYLYPRFGALLLHAAALVAGGQAFAQPGDRSCATPAATAGSPGSANGCRVTARAPLTTEQSPFLGEWELDLTRMPDTYGTYPKRVTYTFEHAGSGKWLTKIDITAPDDSVRHMAVAYRRDGKMAPGEGDTSEADSAAVNAPAPNVLVMSLAKNKSLGSVRVYAVSPDGKEMTESAANVDDTGAPFVRNFHFKRIR
jgi:hypothetical protein